MRSRIARSVAIAAACAVGLGASLTSAPAVAAEASQPKPAVTNFAYKASVFGTKLLLNGVELKTLRDANLQVPCTRKVGVSAVQNSIGSLPIENDLIKVAASSSTSKTYRDVAAGINGIRAINTVADIKLGGTFEGLATPVLKIQGLQSVADSYYDAKANGGKGAFREDHSFSFKGMSLELPEESPIPAEVQQLLDILNQVTAPVTQIVNQVIQLLAENLGTIEIPGLGAISLGKATGTTGKNFASSEAYALKILVNATGEDTVLQLGRAFSRISRPVPNGVFRSVMSALDLKAFNDVISLGGIKQSSIPCEGTNGKVRTVKVNSASLIQDELGVTLSGIKYAYKGLNKGKSARGFTSSQIGQVRLNLPGTLDIIIKGLASRIDIYSPRKGAPVQSKARTTFAQVLVNGTDITKLLKPGPGYDFEDGIVRMLVEQERNYFGTSISGLTIQLKALDVKLDLAKLTTRFFRT